MIAKHKILVDREKPHITQHRGVRTNQNGSPTIAIKFSGAHNITTLITRQTREKNERK